MDAPAPLKNSKINRWLPYWAVFQADVRQTMQSWIYRFWVVLSVLAAVGYLLYHVGVYRKAGWIEPASTLISELLRWGVMISVAIIIPMAAGCISSERGIMADSVLSRGISRFQYFLGKLHARLATVAGTFLFMGVVLLVASYFLLHCDLSLLGSLMALATVAALLILVATCGVTVSAMTNSTLLGIALLWILLLGAGFTISLMPDRFATPLHRLPEILKGAYNLPSLGRLIGWSLLVSFLVGAFGMCYFARRDM